MVNKEMQTITVNRTELKAYIDNISNGVDFLIKGMDWDAAAALIMERIVELEKFLKF